MKFRDAEILITGGAGFIGSNLAEKLVQKKAKITIIDSMMSPYGGNKNNLKGIKKKITFVDGDIRDKRLMQKLVDGKDFVFHLAGQTGRIISMKRPKFDYSINCMGTLTILNAVKRQKKKPKIIFASSRGVIGQPQYFPVDENHPTFPKDVYGAHKLLAEHYFTIYRTGHGIPSTILRFNNVYGPKCQIKSNHYGTINLFIAYALRGKKIQLFGTGKQTRDYVYIDDVVSSLLKATDKKADDNIFFVGTQKEHSLLDVVEMIQKKIGTMQFEIIAYPKTLHNIDFPRFSSSYKKINKILGWSPKTSLSEGINKTIRFYRKNLKDYI